jgi:hypothetical protein
VTVPPMPIESRAGFSRRHYSAKREPGATPFVCSHPVRKTADKDGVPGCSRLNWPSASYSCRICGPNSLHLKRCISAKSERPMPSLTSGTRRSLSGWRNKRA